jgi:hypothetical protein
VRKKASIDKRTEKALDSAVERLLEGGGE